jgi:site-specific DNA-adenine methylase
MMSSTSHGPFPPLFNYFGGKRLIASKVWEYLGDVGIYIEPFCGSCAVLLARPHVPRNEKINDKDGLVANFWRSAVYDSENLIKHLDWPRNEVDFVAWSNVICETRLDLTQSLISDPKFYDPEIAAWWALCLSYEVGSQCFKKPTSKFFISDRGSVGGDFSGIHSLTSQKYIQNVMDRMRTVKVYCGDWDRILGPTLLGLNSKNVYAGIFLDPPYDDGYTVYHENERISSRVREWCKEYGNIPTLRIVLCGYEGEHNELEDLGWSKIEWKAINGYTSNRKDRTSSENSIRERLWISPHCIQPQKSLTLFDF